MGPVPPEVSSTPSCSPGTSTATLWRRFEGDRLYLLAIVFFTLLGETSSRPARPVEFMMAFSGARPVD